MNYINNFKQFEAVIVPEETPVNNTQIRTMDDLVQYGKKNGFDVVRYDEFYNSLGENDRKTAPPRNGPAPFFALFHPIRKRPMFVIDNTMMFRMPGFKGIVDDIISHEKVHGEQNLRRKGLTFNLPDPSTKGYFNDKDEIMAFSWTIALGLSKDNRDINVAIKQLDRGGREPYNHLWSEIKRSCDETTLHKYRKYIYLYLDRLFNKQ